MTIAGDLASALSGRLGCPMDEARGHVKFIMDCANDPNFALRFKRESEWDHGFETYFDVIKFLHDTA